MAGVLVAEVYEYSDHSSAGPQFEYILCELDKCMKGKTSSLKEIVQRGFDCLPSKDQDNVKRQEVLKKLEDADIGKIQVEYCSGKDGVNSYINLTNVVPVDIGFSDMRQNRRDKDNIILKEKYRLSAGNEVTTLKDAQRLTLIYTDTPEDRDEMSVDETVGQREICLNITYLQQ